MNENLVPRQLPTEYARSAVEEVAERNRFLKREILVFEGSKKGENFFGDLYKIKIVGSKEDGSEAMQHLILKIAPDSPSFRDNVPMNRYYRREISAYTNVLPELDKLQNDLPYAEKFKFAKCHGAIAEERKELVIMDDLTVEGFRLYDRLVSLDCDHITMALKYLASIHAAAFVMRKRNRRLFDTLAKQVCHGLDYGIHFNKFVEQNRRQLLELITDDESNERLSKYLKNMEENLGVLVDPTHTEPYNVFCHGDCWTSNILFKYDDNRVVDMRMVDWQVMRLASPVIDIGYIFFTSTDENLRAAHFFDLLNLYYASLKSNVSKMGCDIDECYPRSVYDEHLKSILPFGLMIAISLCPVLLCDRDATTPDLAEANEKYNENVDSNIKFSKTPAERLTGVARDFLKYNLI